MAAASAALVPSDIFERSRGYPPFQEQQWTGPIAYPASRWNRAPPTVQVPFLQSPPLYPPVMYQPTCVNTGGGGNRHSGYTVKKGSKHQPANWLPVRDVQVPSPPKSNRRPPVPPTRSAAVTLSTKPKASRKKLLQVCWDYHSPAGCARPTCKWQHGKLDKWQTAWLQLQRFCFGGQLGTFETLAGLAEAVRIAFAERSRLAAETPVVTATSLEVAVRGLANFGYPFLPDFGRTHLTVDSGHTRHYALLGALMELVGIVLPVGSKVLPVGSFAWGTAIESSDLDVVLVSSGYCEAKSDALEFIANVITHENVTGDLKVLPKILKGATVEVRGGAGLPVLNIRVVCDGAPISADVCCVGQMGSIRDTILFRHMIARMPTLAKLLRLLKRWLRASSIPTSSEGGYPQVFWMRLAVRTYQQSNRGVNNKQGPPTLPGSLATAQRAVREGEAAEKGSSQTSSDDQGSEDNEVRGEIAPLLRSFCDGWSKWLPSYGECLNMEGEDPTPTLKRLAAGVSGATALMCLRKLRHMSETTEDLRLSSEHFHLCPAAAGYWAAFLVPRDGREVFGSHWHGPHEFELLAAYVHRASGPEASIRQCVCAACCDAQNTRTTTETCHSTTNSPKAFLSRKETDWFLWAEHSTQVTRETSIDSRKARSSTGSGRERLVLSPAHFVTQLPGDPATSPDAAQEMKWYHDILTSPSTVASLPAAYQLHKYSRRVLLEARPC